MKVAVSSLGTDINAAVDPRFGRARYFVIVDLENLDCEAIPNPNIDALGGAGIQSAQLIGNKGIEAVITGQVGPNAFQTLSAMGVRIHQTMGGTVRQAIEFYRAGQLPPASQPGPGHAGMGTAGGGNLGYPGAGRGRRGGRGAGVSTWRVNQDFWAHRNQDTSPHMPREQEIQTLKQQAEILAKQMVQIDKRLQELEARNTGTASKERRNP